MSLIKKYIKKDINKSFNGNSIQVKAKKSAKQESTNSTSSFLEKESIDFTESASESKLTPFGNSYIISLAETKLDFHPLDYLNSNYLVLVEKSPNRVSRFFLSLIIVIVASLLCFLLVKYSIDWVYCFFC